MVCNLSKDSHSITCNQRMYIDSITEEIKEEEMVHQMLKGIELDKHETQPNIINQH